MNKKTFSPKQAVGIKYTQGNKEAPKVVAKGTGDIAEQIIELAKEHGVLVHEDEALTQFLNQLDLGQQIPEELYLVIAELIAFSYVLQGKYPESWGALHHKISTEV